MASRLNLAVSGAARRMASVRAAAPVKVARVFSTTAARRASSYEKNITKMEGHTAPVNLYDGHYSDHMKEAQTKVRTDTYGDGVGVCASECFGK